MIQTHEVKLYTSQFNKFKNNDYIILEDDSYQEQDYILFKEIETVGEETKETGVHRMTQVVSIEQEEGLKDGYVFLTLRKL